jgi:amino acid adenylation domain-containing protein
MGLHNVLDEAVRGRPTHTAIIEGGTAQRVDYRRLGRLSDRVRDRLIAIGVEPGDRIGLCLGKSACGVASMLGILKAGAAYVPADPMAPAARGAYVHHDCAVKATIIERRFEAAYREESGKLGRLSDLIVVEASSVDHLEASLDELDLQSPARRGATVDTGEQDLAYILYTSGSTGTPKGVMLSHRNALDFVDWCSSTFEPQPSDIFSSHAPFHFDLSIFDLYVALKHGGTIVLIPAELGKEPQGLAGLIAQHRISIWYSAPSTLNMMAQFGRLQEHDLSSLRMVLFAGEVFPTIRLRSFKQFVPAPRYFNLYGPTETNVCTWYEIPAVIPEERVEPYPIGKTCSNLESVVVDTKGEPVAAGEEGELCIAGGNVMLGYWGMPERSSASFLPSRGDGRRWYKTGDIVVLMEDGNYRYVGRRDRMVKRRGNRVELAEIEVCLNRYPGVSEAAVVALPDELEGVRIKAHLVVGGVRRPSLVELKTFCSQHLPLYMVPDTFTVHDQLPKTSTDKTDYQALKTR